MQSELQICPRRCKLSFRPGGKCFSVVASERGRRVQVKIPRESPGIRSLLVAIEDDLKLCSRKPIADVKSYQIRQQQPSTSNIQSRSQLPKLKTYKIIEQKPHQADYQALLHRTLCRHVGCLPLHNTGCIGRSESRIGSQDNYWVVERYPRACA